MNSLDIKEKEAPLDETPKNVKAPVDTPSDTLNLTKISVYAFRLLGLLLIFLGVPLCAYNAEDVFFACVICFAMGVIIVGIGEIINAILKLKGESK